MNVKDAAGCPSDSAVSNAEMTEGLGHGNTMPTVDAYCELKRCVSHLVSVIPCFWNSATQNAKAFSDTAGLKGFLLPLASTQFTSTTKL